MSVFSRSAFIVLLSLFNISVLFIFRLPPFLGGFPKFPFASQFRYSASPKPLPAPRSVGIVFPIRDRDRHAAALISRFIDFIRERRLDGAEEYHYHLLFAEQADGDSWNKGFLFDAGLMELMSLVGGGLQTWNSLECVAMNDIDMHPSKQIDYGNCETPTRLGSELDCHHGKFPMEKSLGGICNFSPRDWLTVNGMSLVYSGWGGEDDDLYWRVRNSGLIKASQTINTPEKGDGNFHCILDQTERSTPDTSPAPRLTKMKHGSDIWKSDGLGNLKYQKEYGMGMRFDVDWEVAETVKARGIEEVAHGVIGDTSGSQSHNTTLGMLSIYWIGITKFNAPGFESVEVIVGENVGCPPKARFVHRLPRNFEDFFDMLDCPQSRSVLVIHSEIGQGWKPENWHELIRALRDLRGRTGVVHLLHPTDPLPPFLPRSRSICVSVRKTATKSGLFSTDRILHGTSFCNNDRSRQIFAFETIDGRDSDLVNVDRAFIKSMKNSTRLVPICSGETANQMWTRIEANSTDCSGPKDGFNFQHRGAFWVEAAAKTGRYCVGYNRVKKMSRIRNAGNCRQDGFAHVFRFNPVVVPERKLLWKVCRGPTGSRSTYVSFDCDTDYLHVLDITQVNHFIDGICVRWKGGKARFVDCGSAGETGSLLVGFIKFGSVDDANNGYDDKTPPRTPLWCLGSQRDDSDTPCLEKGSTCESCSNGQLVRSIVGSDIPLNITHFSRDIHK